MNVAIIPARGGSKRIPRKNIREFCGKPILAWPISLAIKSQLFDHIVVSTDDFEIAEVAKLYGAEVPFIRPVELSDDFAGTTSVIAHAISWMMENSWEVQLVCCIYPTSVFLTKEDLAKGLSALKKKDCQYAFSVTSFDYPIFRSFKVHSDGGLEMFFPEHFDSRSQDLPKALHDAAQFYWGKTSAWLNQLKIFGRHSIPVMIPRWRVEDIDTEDDWKHAEIMFQSIKESQI